MSKSLYSILEVNKNDPVPIIKKSYFKLARIHHPDKGGNPDTFKEISTAYEILSDDKKRKMYDEFGIVDNQQPDVSSFPGFSFEVNLNDLFGNMFNNPPVGPRGHVRKGKKPSPIIQTIHITLEQFYIGHSVDININRQTFCIDCNHSGAKAKEICKTCGGNGAVSQVVQVGPMSMHTIGPCLSCQGKGEYIIEKCNKCSGAGFNTDKRSLCIKIIPGTPAKELFAFSEVCSDHHEYERPGDVHIFIHEDPNDPAFKSFKRIGNHFQHLQTTITLSLSESLIGCIVQIDGHPGYDDGLFVKIPSGSFQNDTYCLNGFGMPIIGNIGSYGNLYVRIDVSIKPMERTLFTTKGNELLTLLFHDKVRTTECPEVSIQKNLYLHTESLS